MSVSLSVKGFSSKENKEFQKHYKAVKFCIENELSFPKETSEFFKGKVGGDDLEDIHRPYVLKYLENGVEIPLKLIHDAHGNWIKFKVSELPVGVDEIMVELS